LRSNITGQLSWCRGVLAVAGHQRKEQAIKHYERAVELNPSNWRIADLLRNWRRDRKQLSEKQ
ncbi:MAG: tetratricopeptide repeat protein, partial [Acidobacteria bacterium]|nr:tetratricopeptide repeat protein [Acidobacteriota bacterium]